MNGPAATLEPATCLRAGSWARVVVRTYTPTRHNTHRLPTVPNMSPPGRPSGRPGRPWLLTEDTQRRVVEALRAGVPVVHAARSAGISEDSVQKWIRIGREAEAKLAEEQEITEDEGYCLEFYKVATQARAEGAVRDVLLIQKAATGGYVTRRTEKKYRDPETGKVVTETVEDIAGPDWRAAAKVLDSSYGWSAAADAQRVELELTGPGGGPVQISGQVEIAAVAARVAENIRVLSQRMPALDSGASDEDGDSGDNG